MIKVFLSRKNLEGKEIVLQHISNPKKLDMVKEILNRVRSLTFGEKVFYKWEPNLKNFDNSEVFKMILDEKNIENYQIEKIDLFDHRKEIKPLEVIFSEGVARDKSVVVFQWVSDPLKLKNIDSRNVINKFRNEKFPGREMIKQPNIENFEYKPVFKLIFDLEGKEAKTAYFPKFRQRPADGIYKAPRSRVNLGSSSGQATLLTSVLGELVEDKEAFYEKVLRKISK